MYWYRMKIYVEKVFITNTIEINAQNWGSILEFKIHLDYIGPSSAMNISSAATFSLALYFLLLYLTGPLLLFIES